MDKERFLRLSNHDFNIREQASEFWPSHSLDPNWSQCPDFRDDFIPRESLGILSTDQIASNSLIDQSARESLGILNLSALDIGRDSIGLFSLSNSIISREFKRVDRTNTMNFFNDINSPHSSLAAFPGSTTESHRSGSSSFTSSLNPFNNAFICDSLNTTSKLMKSEDALSAFLRATDKNSYSIKSSLNCGDHTFIKDIASDTNELDESVFDPDCFIPFSSKEDSTTKYNLDLTSEPDWLKYDLIVSGNERGADKTVCEAQNVPVQIDKQFGVKSVGPSDNVGVANDDKVPNSSTVNTSQNCSKISASNDLCNILEIPQEDHSILKYINVLSDLVSAKENLTQRQKTEGQRHLTALADLFRDDEICNSKKSLNSSTENVQLIKKQNKTKSNENTFHSLAIRRSSTGSTKLLNEALPLDNLNSQNKAISGTNKFNKMKAIAPHKKEPLRALLPVENMRKATVSRKPNNAGTPDQKIEKSKNALSLNKSSTSIQGTKLKPLAASTPDGRLSNSDKKTNSKQTFSRSFSNSNISAISSEKPSMRTSMPKLGRAELMRTNSENAADRKKDLQKLKRSNSMGRDSKLSIALSKVRMNIITSPYMNTVMEGFKNQGISKPTNLLSRCSGKFAANSTAGKENVKPVTAQQSE